MHIYDIRYLFCQNFFQKINQDISEQNNSIEKVHKNFNSVSLKVNKLSNDVSELHYQLKHDLLFVPKQQ